MASNVRLKTNVVCQKLLDENGKIVAQATPVDLAKRLSYFELNGLSRALPYLFCTSLWQDSALSKQQRQQRNAFLRQGEDPVFFAVDKDAIPVANLEPNPFTQTLEPRPESDSFPSNRVPDDGEKRGVDGPAESAEPDDSLGSEQVDEQQVVLDLPTNHSALVIAPPGTGKTHLLIEKLARILSDGDFESPADQVLVLSFTRAAVREIKARVSVKAQQFHESDFEFLTVKTFDSFAGFMLTYEAAAEFGSGDWDRAIRAFCDVIERGSSEIIEEKLSALRYLVADEIQDLSGDRGRLVLLLTKRVLLNGGAVLMLGDPCQAIYDWDIKNKETELSSLQFLSEMRALIEASDYGDVFRLSKYYRYSNAQTLKFVTEAREAMGEMGDQPAGSQLIASLYHANGVVELSDLESVIDSNERTALLVRSNVEVFDLYSWLTLRGLNVYADEGARGGGWPAWLALALAGWESESIGIGRLEEKISDLFQSCGKSVPEWREVVDEADFRSIKSGSVNLLRVFDSIESRVPSSPEREAALLSVSTVHKSKGLEYENVFLLEPSRHTAGDPEEVRVAYVAATRAKNSLRLIERDKTVFQGIKEGIRKDRVTKNLQYFLTGSDGFELPSLLHPAVIGGGRDRAMSFRENQLNVWKHWIERSLTLSARTILVQGSRRIGVYMLEERSSTSELLIGFLSFGAQKSIHQKIGKLGWEGVYIPELPVSRFESKAFPVWTDDMARILGEAGLVSVPVLRGFADLVAARVGAS